MKFRWMDLPDWGSRDCSGRPGRRIWTRTNGPTLSGSSWAAAAPGTGCKSEIPCSTCPATRRRPAGSISDHRQEEKTNSNDRNKIRKRNKTKFAYGSDRVAPGNAIRTADDVQVIPGRHLADLQEQNGSVVDKQKSVDQRQSERHNRLDKTKQK